MKLLWATDLHLDSANNEARQRFYEHTRLQGADLLVVTGDISNGESVFRELDELSSRTNLPVAFVLGNHDYYGRSFEDVRSRAHEVDATCPRLTWLDESSIVDETSGFAIVGTGGWGDTVHGDYGYLAPCLNDHHRIKELCGHDPDELQRRLKQRGKLDAASLTAHLLSLPKGVNDVVVATHVPPWPECAFHEGRPGRRTYQPHFVCGQVGQALDEWADRNPRKRVLVLCGHTHGSGEYQRADNVRVLTGGATYGKPELQRSILSTFGGPEPLSYLGLKSRDTSNDNVDIVQTFLGEDY